MDTKVFHFIVGVLALVATATTGIDFYVAPNGNDANIGTKDKPFATLERARDTICKMKKAGPLKAPVTVQLQPGSYTLAREMRFESEDSGTTDYPITCQAAKQGAAVFERGRWITGWRQGAKGIWQTQFPEVALSRWYFEQLFVNGHRAMCARMPNQFCSMCSGCVSGVLGGTKDGKHAQDNFAGLPSFAAHQ